MSEYNDESNIPPLHHKGNGTGLLKICINNIPNDFGVSVYDQMQSPKFDSLGDFLDAFFEFI
jgi:hypothetical protein